MKHFQLAEWVDYARGLAPEKEDMAAHLREGCRRCQAVARWLTCVNSIAETEAASRVPEGTLERANAIYGNSRCQAKSRTN